MSKLFILLVLSVGLFAQTQSAESAESIQVVESKGQNRNLTALAVCAVRVISHPFASTYRAYRANAQRGKLFSQVVHSEVDVPILPPFPRLPRLPRFLPIPFPAHSPSLRVFANGGAASALRLSPPNSPLRARLLPLPFVDAVLSPSPTTKQLSERERGGGREDA